jgi:succinate dehydrogenase/fumarate reductase cytochrome b subunit
MLLWLGAILSGYLGYRMLPWWVPAAVSILTVAAQAVQLRNSGYEFVVLSLILNLVVFHATFGIGQAIRQRIARRRKGTR